MTNLLRVSIQYVEAEDRMRLTGEISTDQTIVLWLTQRLFNRLIPNLINGLEQQAGSTPLAEVKQSFAQQKARAELELQPPVRAGTGTQGVLVHSADLKSSRSGMGLQFKTIDGNVVASLHLQPKPLRQWLNIVYDQYLRAGWPTTVWPAWVAEAKPSQTSSRSAVLH